jgi:hypothetical protein
VAPQRPVAPQRRLRSLPAGQGSLVLLAWAPPVALAVLQSRWPAAVPASRLPVLRVLLSSIPAAVQAAELLLAPQPLRASL